MRIVALAGAFALGLTGCSSEKTPPPRTAPGTGFYVEAGTAAAAVGDTDALPVVLQAAFEVTDEFPLLPEPRRGEWLAQHAESGQTYDQFVAADFHRPSPGRDRIHLFPLGDFPAGASPPLGDLERYGEACFDLDVVIEPVIPLSDLKITRRTNPYTDQLQLHSVEILDWLEKERPGGAFCRVAITMVDLYPEESWNFVFGQARLGGHVGVYSFARYDPAFYGEPRTEGYESRMLLRSCKVMGHELGHMFGIQHCIYYECLMNGTNHLEESDARPVHACPACLRKLHHSIGFDPVARYRSLEDFYRDSGLEAERQWVAARRARLSGAKPR